jgi:hypothetical protein
MARPKRIEIPGLSEAEVAVLIKKWSLFGARRYKGEQIVWALRYFYSSKFSFTLQPQAPLEADPFPWIRQTRTKIQYVTPFDLPRLVVQAPLHEELVMARRFFHQRTWAQA